MPQVVSQVDLAGPSTNARSKAKVRGCCLVICAGETCWCGWSSVKKSCHSSLRAYCQATVYPQEIFNRRRASDTLHELRPSMQVKSWAVSPELYPTELKSETVALIDKAVQSAIVAWGSRQVRKQGMDPRTGPRAHCGQCSRVHAEGADVCALHPPPPRQVDALEAEDRLAYACEKAPTDDPVLREVRPRAAWPRQIGREEGASAVVHPSALPAVLGAPSALPACIFVAAAGRFPGDRGRVQGRDRVGEAGGGVPGRTARGGDRAPRISTHRQPGGRPRRCGPGRQFEVLDVLPAVSFVISLWPLSHPQWRSCGGAAGGRVTLAVLAISCRWRTTSSVSLEATSMLWEGWREA